MASVDSEKRSGVIPCIILFLCQPKVILEVCESRRSNIMLINNSSPFVVRYQYSQFGASYGKLTHSIKKVQDVNQTKDRHEPDVDLVNNDTLK